MFTHVKSIYVVAICAALSGTRIVGKAGNGARFCHSLSDEPCCVLTSLAMTCVIRSATFGS